MDKARTETLQRITAHYVAALQAGQRPLLSTYIAQYPQFAEDICDFVSYFHAIEAELPPETGTIPALSEDFRIAIDSAWARMSQSNVRTIKTLLLTAEKSRLTLAELAEKLELSIDITAMLERRSIVAASIPRQVVERLSEVLHLPGIVIQSYLQGFQLKQLAESAAPYQLSSPKPSFRVAIAESEQLTGAQKASWYAVLEKEGL